ncbi:hypothetical protein LXA43DRAFT_1061945 [Ganoderma leucocontextum]|nr:hypothetical protein LXA43DRAFT_1061945 [Ganoderma leucocontextum]
MFMRYLGGGIGHIEVGAKIAVAFDDEDFEWEDVDLEIEEPPEDDNDAAVVSSEEDVVHLARGNRAAATLEEDAEGDGEEGSEKGDEQGEDCDESSDDEEGEERDGEGLNGSDDDDDDKYGAHGYAPPHQNFRKLLGH